MKFPDEKWCLASRLLHWISAIGIVALLLSGWAFEYWAPATWKPGVLSAHVQVGLFVFLMLFFRVKYRVRSWSFKPGAEYSSFSFWGARIVHIAMYTLLILVPISGWIVHMYMPPDFLVLGVLKIPKLLTQTDDESLRAYSWYLHNYSAWAILVLSFLHASAALWHHFVRKDDTLNAMLGR